MMSLPPEILILVIAATPIVELRGSIPLAVGAFEMNVIYAATLSVIGNLIPIFLIYWFGKLWINWTAIRQGFLFRLTDGMLKRSKKVLGNGKYEKFGLFALTLFVAIPLPMTGVWTGTVAAFLFGLPLKRSFPFIALGATMAGIIVALITSGALSFLSFLVKNP
ncbi:MAG: small multi-drug export protein [Patescibacteria group bacterium]